MTYEKEVITVDGKEMEKILAKHPDLKEFLPTCNTYKSFSATGDILEYWEKDDDGHWVDMTDREIAKQQLERELKQLEVLKRTYGGTI